MSLAALGFCAVSIYATFLLWGLLQERLTTTPYILPAGLFHPTQASREEFFRSPLLLNAVQALFSTLIAAVYCVWSAKDRSVPLLAILGLEGLTVKGAQRIRKTSAATTNGNGKVSKSSAGLVSPLAIRYGLVSLFQSCASQLGLLSLSHGISYPTLTLAKSCKLVPVLVANVILYRRRFAPYKYLVVALVTAGISVFMLTGDEAERKRSKPGGNQASSLVGLALLLGNLALDGATNSTQDEIFSNYTISGPQMMLVMNAISTVLMAFSLTVPVPALLGGGKGQSGVASTELASALAFIRRHPEVTRDLLGYATAGAVGQVAIFETLQRFGSLTLVSITVTRKLFTMLLSILVYRHPMANAQWLGVATVFVGLALEAREKRREGLVKAAEKEKAKLKAK